MSKEPRINIDRLVNQIVLDCSLLRWFAYNGRRQDVMIAIDIQRSRARDLEDQVLDFLVRWAELGLLLGRSFRHGSPPGSRTVPDHRGAGL
jgi:hypothetical protein